MAIEYQAQYSNDGGSTWTLLQDWATDRTENLDTSLLSGGIDLRVRARDGDNVTHISDWSTIVQMVAPLAGTSAGTSADTATTTLSLGISGTSAGTSSDTGAIAASVTLSGTSAGTSADTGSVTAYAFIAGTSAGTSTDTGAIAAAAALSGTSAGTSADTATPTLDLGIAGTSAGTSTDSATVGGTIGLAGTSAGTSTDTGTLTELPPLQIDGTNIYVTVPNGWQVEKVPLYGSERLPGGLYKTSHSSDRNRYRVIRVRTPNEPIATIRTWETTLRAAGQRTATGSLLDGTEISAYVRGLSRTPTGDGAHGALTFELVEA